MTDAREREGDTPVDVTTAGIIGERTFGVLLHPSSFPGRDLIGTLGREAHEFVEWLAGTGAGLWQVLPLTINGRDDSPYFSYSAFAGNPWLVDLDGLHAAGLLPAPELLPDASDARVPFAELARRKLPQLESAADRFLDSPAHPWRARFDRFTAAADWLADTCLFFALTERHGTAEWWRWPDGLRRREPGAVEAARGELAAAIARWKAILFFFELQWDELRNAANARGIRVVGDIPIYVAPDSADVWLHQHQFRLDADGGLQVQSGVPPDYFSATGQLWGNPLYRWDAMAADGYAWWLARLRRALELSDVVRIDHFRALAAYWEVPGDADDAIGGRWVAGPGQRFLDAVRAEFPAMPFVAEDLGTLDDAVHHLRDDNGLPGMRILQFGFDGTPDNPHLPHAFPVGCLVYTGTHDNTTAADWWTSLTDEQRREVATYYQLPPDADTGRAVWSLIEAAIGSRAIAAVVPMQDLLVLDARARMNVPSLHEGNWGWRMPPGVLGPELSASLRRLGERYGRC